MSVRNVLWRLASPYDAYVSHVARLNHAIERIRYFTELALRGEAVLQSSLRLVPKQGDAARRAALFREQVARAATSMDDAEFEAFLAVVGGGEPAEVESNRARSLQRMSSTRSGLEHYFGQASHELRVLEERGYNPQRADVARQLRANRLPAATVADYRRVLRELGARVAQHPV
ncbi:MAG: hypothetical protein M0R74_00080 [Dehalococcoidia bacterium]|nr:hypothetical protein [Dehalococcoidia bacterium]